MLPIVRADVAETNQAVTQLLDYVSLSLHTTFGLGQSGMQF